MPGFVESRVNCPVEGCSSYVSNGDLVALGAHVDVHHDGFPFDAWRQGFVIPIRGAFTVRCLDCGRRFTTPSHPATSRALAEHHAREHPSTVMQQTDRDRTDCPVPGCNVHWLGNAADGWLGSWSRHMTIDHPEYSPVSERTWCIHGELNSQVTFDPTLSEVQRAARIEGRGADLLIIDDPTVAADTELDAARRMMSEEYTRLLDQQQDRVDPMRYAIREVRDPHGYQWRCRQCGAIVPARNLYEGITDNIVERMRLHYETDHPGIVPQDSGLPPSLSEQINVLPSSRSGSDGNNDCTDALQSAIDAVPTITAAEGVSIDLSGSVFQNPAVYPTGIIDAADMGTFQISGGTNWQIAPNEFARPFTLPYADSELHTFQGGLSEPGQCIVECRRDNRWTVCGRTVAEHDADREHRVEALAGVCRDMAEVLGAAINAATDAVRRLGEAMERAQMNTADLSEVLREGFEQLAEASQEATA